ncbi:MAG: hypothetical protein HC800_09270 [Phormidesmis sp. RL_2_1]|nr:hypothetical protein [Phormidesmis sp. RL_2_1]
MIRRSLIDIQALPSDYSIWALSVTDRFGDYGLVGAAIVRPTTDGPAGGQLWLDTFLMSCRALGRGIETAFMAKLADFARQQGLSQVVAPYMSGPRNAQVKAFLQEIGFRAAPELAVDHALGSETFVAAVTALPSYPSHMTLSSSASAPQDMEKEAMSC